MSRTYELDLPGVRCINCTKNIENKLKNCKQLKIQINSLCECTKFASVTVHNEELSDEQIKIELNKIFSHYGAQYRTPESAFNTTPEITSKTTTRRIIDIISNHWFKGLVGILAVTTILGLMLSGVALPLSAMITITAASTLLTLYLGWESYYQAINKLFREKTLSMDALFAVSTLATIGISIAAFFVPGLPLLLDAALLIFGFRHIGKAVQESVKAKVIKGLTFQERVTRNIKLVDKTYTKALEKLIPGDEIVLQGGEIIPIDGLCMDEVSSIYDTIITGKNFPRQIKKSDPLFAGMKVADEINSIKIKVTASESTSYLARLDENIKKNYQEKAPIETFTGKVLQYFIPAVIILALLAGVITSIFFPPAVAIQSAIYILVAACPCILGLITPLAVKIGLVKAAEHGVVFKNGKSLQTAAQIDTIVFDLNGTLTQGDPIVRRYAINENYPEQELLAYIAALEENASHPIAKAICSFINVASNTNLSAINKERYGLSAKITDKQSKLKDQILTVGNQRMMQHANIDISNYAHLCNTQEAQHIIYLALGNKAVGYILLHDPLRKDAKRTITELKRMGKKVFICTGADNETANYYARQLSIPTTDVLADCVAYANEPHIQSKNNYIQQLQQSGQKVAMVGDAGNDAVAFSKSDLGIAVKSSASDEVTIANAGATINHSSLLSVATAFTVAKQTLNNIKQNLAISLSYNMLSLVIVSVAIIAAAFALHPAIGVGLMILQTSFVLLNAYRFKCQKLSHLEQVKITEEREPPIDSHILQNLKQIDYSPTAIVTPPPFFFHKKQAMPPYLNNNTLEKSGKINAPLNTTGPDKKIAYKAM